MQIYSIALCAKRNGKVDILTIEKELASFGYFQRGSVGEFMQFFSKTLVERTASGTRQSVEQENYFCHVHVRFDDMAGVVITDSEYPSRVAFSLISKLAEEFSAKYPADSWGPTPNPKLMPFPELKEHMLKYQDPTEADSMMKVQKELDDTKVILHKTMGSVLDRGEKLEDLVQKSDNLSSSSKMFYKTAKKTNSCCVVQ